MNIYIHMHICMSTYIHRQKGNEREREIDMLPTDVMEDVREKYEGIHGCIHECAYINM